MKHAPFWIAIGDIHEDISRLHEIPGLAEASGVIVTGDITFDGGITKAEHVLRPIADVSAALYAQIGNMDRADVTAWLETQGWNLHARARFLAPDVLAMGLGGSNLTPFHTPSEFPESELAAFLDRALAEARELTGMGGSFSENGLPAGVGTVLVSHTPPHDTACDRIADKNRPVGSAAVRQFIERHQPDVCLCGHIHESRGQDVLGRTQIINTGMLRSGGYAVLWTQPDGSGVRLRAELRSLD